MLNAQGWSWKNLRVLSLGRGEDLRDDYREWMSAYTADDLVFIDESIFNEETRWQQRAYRSTEKGSLWILDANRENP